MVLIWALLLGCTGGECETYVVYQDADGDGWGDPDVSQETCEDIDGYTSIVGDCDDTSGERYPGNEEVAGDDVDNDCDDATIDSCGDTAPVLEVVVAEEGGIETTDACGDPNTPYIHVTGTVADTDGDLHAYTVHLGWDSTIDGAVEVSGSDAVEATGTYGMACGVTKLDIQLKLCVTGNPPYATELEFGMTVTDSEGQTSNLATTVFTTPNEDGTYPEGDTGS